MLDVKREEKDLMGIKDTVKQINSLETETNKSLLVNNAAMLERSTVPDTHRRVADGYMIIKKIFGFPFVQCKITENEKEYLGKYDFNPLEYCTSKQIEEELEVLKKWNNSVSQELKEASDTIINIRVKELKYLIATNYVKVSSELYTGYKVLERYLESVSKYCND